MPDSMGKRQRRDVKQKKAAAREERRLARNQRREDRAAGLIPDETENMEPLDGPVIHPDLVDAEPDPSE
jgi:hypothetical protein